ncbi:MAG TPA: phytanoyl-CoA dioxygenase [Methyloprofundus sp.]|nr:phytanoyl-CoA dioxygenase [Methyloprofundus sp.]HIM07046.1 phytanoyl-CoA dioxygenase [Gammaproteobacteria bacterium]
MAHLSKQQLEHYQQQGYLSPIRVVSKENISHLRDKTETLGSARGGQLPPALNIKAHLLIPWLWDLVRSSAVIEPVVDILGEDVLCWGSSFFDKLPGSTDHVPWHQDSTYWGLEKPDALTAWIAFSTSDRSNGCLRVVPMSHGDQLKHVEMEDPSNMLQLRSETLAESVEAPAVDIILNAGEMSLHHQRLIHGSEPNTGTQRRAGFAIRYIAGYLKGVMDEPNYATLVHGKDLGGFLLEEKPEGLFHREALKRHCVILKRGQAVVHRE